MPTRLPEVVIVEPEFFGDSRGYFFEVFHSEKYAAAGLPKHFLQDNQSRSHKGTLRGLHYQLPPHAQGKLVQALTGRILDVAVDIRRSSPTFKQWVGVELSDDNKRLLWVPAGFAHGFLVLSESADVAYKCTSTYAPDFERNILWNDRELNIDWKITQPELSARDKVAPPLNMQNDLFK